MPRPTKSTPTNPPPYRTTDYRVAGIALSVPGAALASVTPDPTKPRKLYFDVTGLAADFATQLAAGAYTVGALDVLRNQERCLKLLQAHQQGAR